MAVLDRPTLIEKLSAAAVAAIENVRPDLERDERTIRSLVLELAVDGRQQLRECDAYVMRRVNVRECLGLARGED